MGLEETATVPAPSVDNTGEARIGAKLSAQILTPVGQRPFLRTLDALSSLF